jgi:alpha-beta hydrolase superfamily lysophospholipase
VLYDRRGHGRSDRPPAGYDIDTLADDLAAVIGHFDLHGPPSSPTRWDPRKPSATSPATATPASPGWCS